MTESLTSIVCELRYVSAKRRNVSGNLEIEEAVGWSNKRSVILRPNGNEDVFDYDSRSFDVMAKNKGTPDSFKSEQYLIEIIQIIHKNVRSRTRKVFSSFVSFVAW